MNSIETRSNEMRIVVRSCGFSGTRLRDAAPSRSYAQPSAAGAPLIVIGSQESWPTCTPADWQQRYQRRSSACGTLLCWRPTHPSPGGKF
jgi:hypothetical protein